MGCTAAKDGLSVQFYNEKGHPDGAPVYGLYAELRGMKRDKITGGIEMSPDEVKHKGSDDWLTVIAVADTKGKLDEILSGYDCDGICTPETSASSRRATVELHIGGIRQKFPNRITIASGPFTQAPPLLPKIDVAHVKVLAENAELGALGDKHPLVVEFEGSAFTLEDLVEIAKRERR